MKRKERAKDLYEESESQKPVFSTCWFMLIHWETSESGLKLGFSKCRASHRNISKKCVFNLGLKKNQKTDAECHVHLCCQQLKHWQQSGDWQHGLVQNAAPKASLHFCPDESTEILRWHSTSWHLFFGQYPQYPQQAVDQFQLAKSLTNHITLMMRKPWNRPSKFALRECSSSKPNGSMCCNTSRSLSKHGGPDVGLAAIRISCKLWASENILLMEEILHHLGWLKPYK